MTLPKYDPRQLVEQNVINTEHLGHFMYYDVNRKRWKLHGYYCRHCDKIFSKLIRANNHLSCCKVYNKTKVYFVDTFDIILDNNRNPWKPIL